MTSAETLAKVERVCAQMHRDGEAIRFTIVAQRTGISRTSLYRDRVLRAVIDEHRTRSHDPRTLSGLSSEITHLRVAVEVLATRVRRHEELFRHLEEPRRHKQKAN